ncbi:MAG TPA: hypothetical protein VK810_03605 [Dongiaceae bacterium]|jgi:hypothetical protein|nr:hypothetical protein [Dongiaceae bacterium]
MKKIIIVSLVLVIAVLGFLILHSRTTGSDAHIMPDQAMTFSNNGFTVRIGAITMNGTNVPASNIKSVRIESTNIPPGKNDDSK